MSEASATKAPHVHAAMCAVKLELAAKGGITKDRTAPDAIGGYRFRGIDDLDDVLCGLTAKHSLCLYPRVISEASETQVDGKGRIQRHVKIHLGILIASAVDGSTVEISGCGEGIDTGDKATGKATSNARKIATFAAFMVPTHGENVEEYVTQVAPIGTARVVQAENPNTQAPQNNSQQAAPPPAKKAAKQQAAPQQQPAPKAQVPAHFPTPEWAGGEPAAPPEPEAMMGRVGEVNTFPLLHAFAEEANKMADGPGKGEVFGAIINRGVALFATCRTAEEVKQGLALYKALGSPKALAEAGNAAYARFRGGPQAGAA